ncbi:MAG: hypothetical protein ACYTAF_10385, partial [Planctomycetota bacterium]
MAEMGRRIEERRTRAPRWWLRCTLLGAFLLAGAGFLYWGVFLHEGDPHDRLFTQAALDRMLEKAMWDVEGEAGVSFRNRPKIRAVHRTHVEDVLATHGRAWINHHCGAQGYPDEIDGPISNGAWV